MKLQHEYELVSVHSISKIHGPKPFTNQLPPVSPSPPQIKFLISYAYINYVWNSRILLSESQRPTMITDVTVDLDRFQRHHDEAYALIQDNIKTWLIPDHSPKKLIHAAITRAVESLPEIHHCLYVQLRLSVVSDQYVQKLHPVNDRTIPATLGGCSCVCLEEFSEVGKSVYMTCGHVFHDDCIKKWLKINHSCPLCRFHMPTETRFMIDYKRFKNECLDKFFIEKYD